MQLGIGLGLSRATLNPLARYAIPSGALAVWDASQLASLYQDSTGTTPVTAAGQSVGRWSDLSDNGNRATQATASARPTYQTGPAAVTFDGVDDYLDTGIIPGAAGTIAARFRPSSAGRYVLGAVSGGASRSAIGVNNSGYPYAAMGSDTASLIGSSSIISVWSTMALTWDGTTASLALNGAIIASAPQAGVAATRALFIGALNNVGSPLYFANGPIGGAAVYDRALSTAEHLELHKVWEVIA